MRGLLVAGLLFAGVLALLPVVPVMAAVDMGGKSTSNVYSDKDIDELMAISGLSGSIATAPSLIYAAVERSRPNMTDENRLDMSQKVTDSGIVDALIGMVRSDIRKFLDAEAKKDVLAWYNGETGKKIVLADRAATTADGLKSLQDAAASGASRVRDFDRTEIFRELDDVSRASATQRLVLDDFLEMLTSVVKDQASLLQAKSGILTAQRDAPEQMVYAMDFVYSGIKDDELRSFISFFKTKNGQKWVQVLRGHTRALWKKVNEVSVSILQQDALKALPQPQ